MAEKINKDAVYRAAKPKEKDYTINDGSGLVLLVKSTGVKSWRFIYRFKGKQNRLGFGAYPDITLETARRKAEEARGQIANGIDPSEVRKQEKAQKKAGTDRQNRLAAGLPIINSFEHVTRDWLASISHTVRDITHHKKTRRLELHVFPCIGSMPISEIKSPDIYNTIKPIIAKNELDTAHRAHSDISSVFSYAIAHGLTDYDPAQAVAAQIPAQKVKHRAALTEPKDVARLLRDISNYQGTFVVQCALRLSPLLFQRPGEIRQMEWKDIHLDAKEWRYFVTKTEVQHIVPLSTQALTILDEIKPLTGNGRYVFPSSRGDGRPMSDGTILTALKTLGYDSDTMTAHGFRTTASTLLNEQGWSPDAIERQLCHMPRDAVRAAYNRAQYLDERRRLMQSWADYLDGLKAGAIIVPFQKQA